MNARDGVAASRRLRATFRVSSSPSRNTITISKAKRQRKPAQRLNNPEASNGVFTLLTCRASAADHELAVDVALDLPDPHAIPGRVARVDGLALLGSEDLQLGPARNLPDERARAAWSH